MKNYETRKHTQAEEFYKEMWYVKRRPHGRPFCSGLGFRVWGLGFRV